MSRATAEERAGPAPLPLALSAATYLPSISLTPWLAARLAAARDLLRPLLLARSLRLAPLLAPVSLALPLCASVLLLAEPNLPLPCRCTRSAFLAVSLPILGQLQCKARCLVPSRLPTATAYFRPIHRRPLLLQRCGVRAAFLKKTHGGSQHVGCERSVGRFWACPSPRRLPAVPTDHRLVSWTGPSRRNLAR